MPLWVFESLCVSVREREILWGRGVYSTGDEGRGEGGKEWTVNESQSVGEGPWCCHSGLSAMTAMGYGCGLPLVSVLCP